MFEQTSVNWRGPLLACGIFAAVSGMLLLMAHQNESNSSEQGSSFRRDPYGSSLLFDSYQRAGYQVERSEDDNSLAAQDAPRTTAFFISGNFFGYYYMGGDKFPSLLQNFLERGGRVVLVQPSRKIMLKSPSQGWEISVELQWDSKASRRPSWATPTAQALPRGAGMMYLVSDQPWLKTGPEWTALYSATQDHAAMTSPGESEKSVPHPRVYAAVRHLGRGEIVVASQAGFLLNEALKTHPDPTLLEYLTAGRPVVWTDEALHGLNQDQGVLWLIERYRLQPALLLFWASLFTGLWALSGELVRQPAALRQAFIVRRGESAGVAARRLLRRTVPSEQVVAVCWEQFRHRYPRDAEAIARGAETGAQLHLALSQPPLEGYKKLGELIQQRRCSARVLVCSRREVEVRSSEPQADETFSQEVKHG